MELDLGLKLEWLEGVSKTLGRLVYFVPYLYREGEAPPITKIQNTQAPSGFLTTSIPKLIFAKIKSSKLKVCRFLLADWDRKCA